MGCMIGVNYKSAHFLCHSIHEAMAGANPTGHIGGKPDSVVALDKTYCVGKTKGRTTRESAKKKAVLVLAECDARRFA